MKIRSRFLTTLATTAALAGGTLAVAGPASAATSQAEVEAAVAEAEASEPGTIATIVGTVPGSGDVAEELATTLHVDTTAILNAAEEVAKDDSIDNIQKLLDALGVHGL